MLLVNAAVSTPGDAEQYVEIDGKRYSHIVDPKTGVGVLGQFSVTVTARHCIDSDVLDTTVAHHGTGEGTETDRGDAGSRVLILRRENEKRAVVRFEGFKEKD